jgi:hypothetical protein
MSEVPCSKVLVEGLRLTIQGTWVEVCVEGESREERQGFRVQGTGFRVQGLGLWAWAKEPGWRRVEREFREEREGFRVQNSGFRV